MLLPEFEYRPSRHAAKRGHSDYLDEFDNKGKVRPYRERNGHHIEQMIQAVAYLFTESTAERAIESMQQTGMWYVRAACCHCLDPQLTLFGHPIFAGTLTSCCPTLLLMFRSLRRRPLS